MIGLTRLKVVSYWERKFILACEDPPSSLSKQQQERLAGDAAKI
jgi:hypothetical protein